MIALMRMNSKTGLPLSSKENDIRQLGNMRDIFCSAEDTDRKCINMRRREQKEGKQGDVAQRTQEP